MPLKLNSTTTDTQVIVQEQTQTVQFDEVKIISHEVNNESMSITIMYERLLNGQLLDERRQKFVLKGAGFGRVAMLVPSGTDTLYTELKNVLYTELMAGVGLTGTVI